MAGASLSGTDGIVAIAALAVAVLALVACAALVRAMQRLRSAQKLVLGNGAKQDMIAHSAALQAAFEALREYTEDVAVRLDRRLQGVETALKGAIAHHALVRYDAYNELSGQQSVSIALLDEHRCGVVITCIHHREQARVYAKQVRDGVGELELSPEETEAVRIALGQSVGDPSQRGPAQTADAADGRSA